MPTSPTPKVFGYNAEQTDYTIGLQYLRARYYDTAISRFVQEDDYKGKFTRPASMNRYIYTEGNPVTGIDPSGYDTNGFYMEVNGVKYYSKSDLEAAENIAKKEFDEYNELYISAVNAVYGDENNRGSYYIYLEAFYKYKEAFDNSNRKSTKKILELYEDQWNKYEIYGNDFDNMNEAEKSKEPYWAKYDDLKTALDNWDSELEEYQILQKINEDVGYTHQEITTATNLIDNEHDTYNDDVYEEVNYPVNVTAANGLCTTITNWNTSSVEEALAIWGRLSSTYSEGSYALEMLFQVLFSEAVGKMSTTDLMIQFALQFSGKEEKIDEIYKMDKIDNGGYEYELNYNMPQHGNLDVQEDCAGFVDQLYYLFYGKHLKTGSQYAEGQYSNNLSIITEGIVNPENLTTGDLIYYEKGSSDKNPDHVAMFFKDSYGNGWIIEASGQVADINVESYNAADISSIGYLDLESFIGN